MDDKTKVKWYFKNYSFIAGFLCIGPFALPLVWFNPGLSGRKKFIITLITLAVTYLIWVVLARSIGSITKYYSLMME